MPDYTSRLSLVKPRGGSSGVGPGEPVDIDQINGNMDKLDAATGATLSTSTTRPSAPFPGQLARDSDTRGLVIWDGDSWEPITSGIRRNPGRFEYSSSSTPGGVTLVGYQVNPTQPFAQRLVIDVTGTVGANSAGGWATVGLKFKGAGRNVYSNGAVTAGAAADAETTTPMSNNNGSYYLPNQYAPLRRVFVVDIPANATFQWSVVNDLSVNAAMGLEILTYLYIEGEF